MFNFQRVCPSHNLLLALVILDLVYVILQATDDAGSAGRVIQLITSEGARLVDILLTPRAQPQVQLEVLHSPLNHRVNLFFAVGAEAGLVAVKLEAVLHLTISPSKGKFRRGVKPGVRLPMHLSVMCIIRPVHCPATPLRRTSSCQRDTS